MDEQWVEKAELQAQDEGDFEGHRLEEMGAEKAELGRVEADRVEGEADDFEGHRMEAAKVVDYKVEEF